MGQDQGCEESLSFFKLCGELKVQSFNGLHFFAFA
jgi:hypothetical protein